MMVLMKGGNWKMRISEMKKQALGALKGKWGFVVLGTFVFFLVYMVVPLPFDIILSGGLSVWFNQEETTVTADIFNILISVLLIPFSVAFYWFFLSISRSETPQLSDVVYDLCRLENLVKTNWNIDCCQYFCFPMDFIIDYPRYY